MMPPLRIGPYIRWVPARSQIEREGKGRFQHSVEVTVAQVGMALESLVQLSEEEVWKLRRDHGLDR